MYNDIFINFTNIQLAEVIESPDEFKTVSDTYYNSRADICHQDLMSEVCKRFCHIVNLGVMDNEDNYPHPLSTDWPW